MRTALQEPCEPSQELTERVRAIFAQEIIPARRKKYSIAKKLLIAAVLAAMLSGIALAIYFLRPMDEIAEVLGNDNIAEAFRSENAVVIDKTEQSGDYMITLMGIAPTETLELLNKGEESGTYAVIAISKTDGTLMPDVNSEEYIQFYAMSFIKGVKPWQAAVEQTQGSTVIDGVLYLLLGCDALEVFADRGVYLAVTDYPFYSQSAFTYDEDSGAFSRNEDYSGVNVLFELPLDVSKADPQRADEVLGLTEKADVESKPESTLEPSIDVDDNNETEPNIDELLLLFWDSDSYMAMTIEQHVAVSDYIMRIPLEEFTLIEDSVKVCTVDDEGYISYEYEGDGWSTSSKTIYSAFSSQPVGEFIREGYSRGSESITLHVYVLSPNGDVTFMLYELPKWNLF